jgi:hypothetical protein
VNPEEIRKMLRASPFVPFRVHTSDGKHYDIPHPEMAMITRMVLVVGRPVRDPTQDIPRHTDIVSTLHIVGLEPLVPA